MSSEHPTSFPAQAITSFIAWHFLARAHPPIHMRVLARSSDNEIMGLYLSMSAFSVRTVVRGKFPSTRDHLVHVMHHASYSVKSLSLFPVLRTPAVLYVRTGRSSDKDGGCSSMMQTVTARSATQLNGHTSLDYKMNRHQYGMIFRRSAPSSLPVPQVLLPTFIFSEALVGECCSTIACAAPG